MRHDRCESRTSAATVAVVIPCYRCSDKIFPVIEAIGPEVSQIWVVDDCCPQRTGRLVQDRATDPRVRVLFNERNLGVGGAVIAGYRAALTYGADIVVKIDGDGQMDPRLVPDLIAPLLSGEADYAKGNRFHSLYNVRTMPRVRLFGNAVLSFATKLSSGYWSVFDPTNGFTAAHIAALGQLELRNISERYFFESDMLVNLGGIRAVVIDVPMEAVYADEESNLRVRSVALEFLVRNIRELAKRMVYSYFLRDFNIASLEMVGGIILTTFGLIFGAWKWMESVHTAVTASTGTVILATLPILMGFQLLLGFVSYDISNEPTKPLQRIPPRRKQRPETRESEERS